MGTRSTIQFKEDNEILLCIYQQYDGHTDAVGKDIKTFIKSGKWVNGFGLYDKEKEFNGFSDFVLQFVLEFKSGVGGMYATTKEDKQEYNYIVDFNSKTNEIKVSCEEEESYNEIIKVYEE